MGIPDSIYVPGIKILLISERDLGKQGVDILKRNWGNILYLERSRCIVGQYSFKATENGGLYVINYYMKDPERQKNFYLKGVEQALEVDV